MTIAAPAEEEITDTFFAQAQPEKLYSALEYENLLDGATLRYENYANSVKESIIIPARQDDYTYSFRMQATGLTPEPLDDGSISLTNADGETIYTIPAPYMIDAKDETSHEAFYTLEEADGCWLLTVTADADWMNDTNRAYPVLLDPTVTEATNINDFSSGYTRSGDIYANCNEDTGLYVGNDGTNHGAIRSYIHINRLPKLPTGSEVTGASFSLWQFSFTGSSLDIGLYGLTKTGNIDGRNPASGWESWAKALTWSSAANGQADYHGYLSDQVTTSSANNSKYLHFDITTLAFEWYDSEHAANKCHVDGCSGGTCDNDKCDVYGYQKNYGFLLKSLNESAISRATFHSSKSPNHFPYIVVEYRSARGIEPDFTYQTAAIGRAGTVYVGDFDMQTTLVVPLVSDPSDTIPLSVSLVYNSDMAERYFTSADIPNTRNFENMKVGRGWKLSLQETVVCLSSGQLVYTDGDGTEHYYIYSADDGGYIEADNNTRLKITSSGTQYTLSDEYGNEKIFTNGYLTEVRDAYGNALYYCYNDTECIQKWGCSQCGTQIEKADAALMEEITELLNILICNPEMIHSHRHSQKEPPIEQRRLDNEIARTLEGYDFDKDALREKLFQRAALCYRQIGNEAYIENQLRCTLELAESLDAFDAELTNKIVKQIRLSEDGSVRIILINEQEVRKEQTDHGSSSPSDAT